MQAYENGLGPDILTLVELESDFSPNDYGFVDPADFLGQYAYTTIDRMLGEEFNTDVAKLPSEWLLLKAFQDAEVGPYELEVGEPPLGNDGKPSSVQKNVVYSKFPILSERTKLHETERARPILEVWIDIEGSDLAVFVNHWKSGAGSASMEEIRVQNAQVLAKRIQELASEKQPYDIVLAGDFNSDYNQKTRYSFSTTGLQDVLEVKGIVSNTLYDNQGLSYVDQSFRVDDFGFNTYSGSGTPKRWSFYGQGTGYSDHLPLSIRLKKVTDYFQGPFSVNDDDEWVAIPVRYNRPTERYGIEAFTTGEAWTEPEFYDTYFELEASLAEDGDVIVEGQKIDVYAPSFNFTQKAEEWLKQHSSQIRMVEFASRENQVETIRALDIRFIGRWSQYRGNWQFVVESESFVEILEE
jgi:endonuclease/exonuclease/phosphatase family metal-dependent hydrolase